MKRRMKDRNISEGRKNYVKLERRKNRRWRRRGRKSRRRQDLKRDGRSISKSSRKGWEERIKLRSKEEEWKSNGRQGE